jgi:rhamnulokinase
VSAAASLTPGDKRALVAVDLGAESCRVSLLRWQRGHPEITLVHRFPNGPVALGEGLHWLLDTITSGVDEGLRRCAQLAAEGIRSIAVDGWAVDYVRLERNNQPLAPPFCYRDERTVSSERDLHQLLSPERLYELTGVQPARINTLYQLHADARARLAPGRRWLNLPEYILTRWGAAPFAEFTNATHTGLVDLRTRTWSGEIFAAAQLDIRHAAPLNGPGTRLGKIRGPLADLPALRDTELIAPACHDTASAVAGISAQSEHWAYISCGTWSLIGAPLQHPRATPAALRDGFTNLGAVGGRTLFHKSLNGMWLLKQCMDAWQAAGASLTVEELIAAAEREPAPAALVSVADPELSLIGSMPARINAQLRQHGHAPLDESPTAAPRLAVLLFHSLAAAYADALDQLRLHTGHSPEEIVFVGGGARNHLLCRLTAERTGLPVRRGAPESSTVGNFAVQLAALEAPHGGDTLAFADAVSTWAATLLDTVPSADPLPPACSVATS